MNASSRNDGSSALVIASRGRSKALGLKPLATKVGYASVGVEPAPMGIGPMYSAGKLLSRIGIDIHEGDIAKLQKALASRSRACMCELGIDPTGVDPNGRAIASGHSIGATGAITPTKLVSELNPSRKEWGLAAMCMGGGQGNSVLIRNEGLGEEAFDGSAEHRDTKGRPYWMVDDKSSRKEKRA